MNDEDFSPPYLFGPEIDEPTPEEFEALRAAAARRDWRACMKLLHEKWEPFARAARERQGETP